MATDTTGGSQDTTAMPMIGMAKPLAMDMTVAGTTAMVATMPRVTTAEQCHDRSDDARDDDYD